MRTMTRLVATVAVVTQLGAGQRAVAQKVLADGIKELAAQIAGKVAKEQKHKIAVLPFKELEGQPTVLGAYLAEALVTDLFENPGLDIVERTMLDKVIGELKLDRSGLIDPETAKRVGKIVGVDAIVTGTITDLASYVAVNCRLIDAQTGRIFAAAQTRIAKDADVQKIMAALVGGRGEPESGQIDRGTQRPRTAAKSAIQREMNGFLFELKGCKLSGAELTCDLLITNRKQDRELTIRYPQSRLIDEAGNETRSAGGFLASDPGRGYSLSRLVTDVPTKAQVTFQGLKPEMLEARLFEINCYGEGDFLLQFRDVPIVRR
jgi:TolB-like protein